MRALTLWRPWPWAMLHAPEPFRKKLENRPRPLPKHLVDVPIAMHAGKHVDLIGQDLIFRICGPTFKLYGSSRAADEGIVGVVTFSRCITTVEEAQELGQEIWYFGPFAYVVSKAVALDYPLMCKGSQGWWTVPPDIEAKIERQLAA